jgi:nitrogen fixation NifU-like protein
MKNEDKKNRPGEINLEDFAKKLQEQILEQVKLQYTNTVIDYWTNPRNFSKIENPDGYSKVTGSCGDTMEMFIKIEDEKVQECTFMTDGCGSTIACGVAATELTKDKTFTQALASVSAEAILRKLGGLPEENVHCAQLASETLRKALADYLYQKKNRWKGPYRKN